MEQLTNKEPHYLFLELFMFVDFGAIFRGKQLCDE